MRLYEPVQAHKALAELWPRIKAELIAGHRLELTLKRETRSTDQNRRMWSMLNAIAHQVEWYGQRMSPEDWKHIFSASLKKQRAVPGLDGGFVVLGQSTSRMTKAEMSELMTLMEAFMAERNLNWEEDHADHL